MVAYLAAASSVLAGCLILLSDQVDSHLPELFTVVGVGSLALLGWLALQRVVDLMSDDEPELLRFFGIGLVRPTLLLAVPTIVIAVAAAIYVSSDLLSSTIQVGIVGFLILSAAIRFLGA